MKHVIDCVCYICVSATTIIYVFNARPTMGEYTKDLFFTCLDGTAKACIILNSYFVVTEQEKPYFDNNQIKYFPTL